MTSIIHKFPIFYKYNRKEIEGDVFNPIKRIMNFEKILTTFSKQPSNIF